MPPGPATREPDAALAELAALAAAAPALAAPTAAIDATLATDPFIFPDAALEAQLNVFAGLSEEDEIYMNDAFSALQGN